MKITFNNLSGGATQQGFITLEGNIPVSVTAAIYAAMDKMGPSITADMGKEESTPAIIDIHPLDFAELIMDAADKSNQVIDIHKYHEVMRIDDKVYHQTTTVPRKEGKHKIV